MKKQLIVDSGSTKADWRVIENGIQTGQFFTEGYNPFYLTEDEIVDSLRRQVPDFDLAGINNIYFYGAGCSTKEKCSSIRKALLKIFPAAQIEVDHDLLGAARALLQHSPGFAAILGTGMNSCLYDGKNITYHIDSLGYELGDEGSGASIGRRFLRALFRKEITEQIIDAFYKRYSLSREEIYDALLNKPMPNRFLAQFAAFIGAHLKDENIRKLVDDSFEEFFVNVVTKYPGYRNYSFNCVGSVGYYFREILSGKIRKFEMKEGQIVQAPGDLLVKFHTTSF